MAFDGIVLRSVKCELEEKLTGGKIDKIYQPEKDEIVLSVRTPEGGYKLFLSADPNYPRVHLTNESFTNPDTPPLFCMLLRKHLGGGKILSFEQLGSDRILKIKVSSYNELGDITEKYLIIEIMSRHSNIILTDESYRVTDSIKRVDFTLSSKRQLLPGLIYEPAPGQGKLDFTKFSEEELREKIFDGEEVDCDKLLMKVYEGISPLTSREGAFYAMGEGSVHILPSDNEKKEKLLSGLCEYLEKINKGEFAPGILYEGSIPKYFSAVELNQYGEGYKKEQFDSVSLMLDTFYQRLHFERKMSIRTHELTTLVTNLCDKLKKKIQIHRDTLLNEDSLEELRLCGELLTSNIHLLKGGESEITVLNYYTGENKTVKLNPMHSPSQNIQKYFKDYRRGKTGVAEAKKQLEAAEKELAFLESELVFLKNASSQADIEAIKEELIREGYIKKSNATKKKRGQPKSTFLTFETSDGFQVISGRNNIQNDELTLKIARPYDLWFHIKDYPGTHTILKLDGREATDTAIFEAAKIAASLSKTGGAKIPIDYTFVRYVKKPSGAKPGMVIYTDYKTIMVEA